MYRLKNDAPAFEVVDGPLAGRKFVHGEAYEEIPPGEKKKFEKAKPPEPEKKKEEGKGK